VHNKNPLFKTHLGYKVMQQKPKMDFEDWFFVAHDFVFGNKNPPSKPTWYTKSCHKKSKMDFEDGFLFVAHDFAFGNKMPIFENPSGIQNYGFLKYGFLLHTILYLTLLKMGFCCSCRINGDVPTLHLHAFSQNVQDLLLHCHGGHMILKASCSKRPNL
jgi:hypothetical protein